MAVIVRNTIFFITCYLGVGNFGFNYYMISLFLHNEKMMTNSKSAKVYTFKIK